MKKKKKKKKNSKQFKKQFKKKFFTKKAMIILFLTAIILCVMGMGYRQLEEKAAVYEKTIQELNTQIDELEDTNATLEEEKDNLDTDAFKERLARERLGMIGADEYALEQSEKREETTETTEEGVSEEEESGKNASDFAPAEGE